MQKRSIAMENYPMLSNKTEKEKEKSMKLLDFITQKEEEYLMNMPVYTKQEPYPSYNKDL